MPVGEDEFGAGAAKDYDDSIFEEEDVQQDLKWMEKLKT